MAVGIIFKNDEHREFFECNGQTYANEFKDAYKSSLFYILGINDTTRQHISSIYNFDTGMIKPECLEDAWQTSSSIRTTALAFNMFNDFCYNIEAYINDAEEIPVDKIFMASSILIDEDREYFFEGVRIRYGSKQY